MKYGFVIIVPCPDGTTTERDRIHDEFDSFLREQALGDIHKCSFDHANNRGLILITLIHRSALAQARVFLASLKSKETLASWEELPGSGQQPTGDPDFPGLRRIPNREV